MHEHKVKPAPSVMGWYCDVCRNKRPTLRFKCSEGCNWDACGECMASDGHSGDWRGESKTQWCSLATSVDGPICAHPGRIITHEHWSCCGRQAAGDKGAGCFKAGQAAAEVKVSQYFYLYLWCVLMCPVCCNVQCRRGSMLL